MSGRRFWGTSKPLFDVERAHNGNRLFPGSARQKRRAEAALARRQEQRTRRESGDNRGR